MYMMRFYTAIRLVVIFHRVNESGQLVSFVNIYTLDSFLMAFLSFVERKIEAERVRA